MIKVYSGMHSGYFYLSTTAVIIVVVLVTIQSINKIANKNVICMCVYIAVLIL